MKIIKELTLFETKLEIIEDKGRYFYRVDREIVAEISKNDALNPEEILGSKTEKS